MRPKTISHALIFVFLIISACSGKNQLIRNTHAEAHASSEVNTNPKKTSPSPIADESKGIAATSSNSLKNSREPEERRLHPQEAVLSNKKAEKSPRITHTPSLPSLSSTATVSTTAPIVEEPSLPPAVKETPAQKALSPASVAQAPIPKKPAPSVADEQDIDFNFDNADIHEVVSIISDILGFNYIVDPRLGGVVNIHTKGKISKKDLFPILESLLKMNNFTIIRKGEFYHIIPLQNAKQEYIPPQKRTTKERLPLRDTLLFQIVPLKSIAAQDIANIIKPLMSTGGDLIMKDNILILMDSSANIIKLLSIIDLFDIDIFDRLHVQVYEAVNADVEELAADLDTIFQAFELTTTSAKAGGITFVPITRINMLLAVSSNERLLEKAIQWAQQLDTDVSETTIKVFVYYVQNGKAADIAGVLTQVFKGVDPKKKETTFKSKLRETKPAPAKGQKQPPKAPAKRTRQLPSATSVEEVEVDIVVDEVNNALVIRANERDYRIVEKTIKKLDIYPKQVLIEVLIAEIRLDDEFKLGVEWRYTDDLINAESDTYKHDVDVTGGKPFTDITSGLQYMLLKTNQFKATLKAFASDDKVNILSSPHIIASDNMEAKIDIAEEIPIVSGKVTTTSADPVTTETVEYRDTGIILTVTPHINDRGLVTLDISQEVSEVSEKVATGTENPIFLKRTAQTSMVVQNGQSVIIGGLIRETWSTGRTGVPILSRIPVMGALFGVHKKIANRSELMLLLTPHVITSIEEADLITQEFQDKLTIIE